MSRVVECPECTKRQNGEPVRFPDEKDRMQKCPWCLALLVIVAGEARGEIAILHDRSQG